MPLRIDSDMIIYLHIFYVFSKDVNFEELARCTDDFNGAQCKAVCVEAVSIHVINNVPVVILYCCYCCLPAETCGADSKVQILKVELPVFLQINCTSGLI